MRYITCADCDHRYCEFCNAGDKYQKKAKANVVTNFERIKAMSIEEMAEFIANDRKRIIEPMVKMFKIFRLDKICDIAKENIKEWLETEVKE